MPSFVKTPKDEARWERSKRAAAKSTKEDSDSYWKLSNYIYHKMGKTEEDIKMAEHYKNELEKEELDKSETHVYTPQEVAIAVLSKTKELLEKSELAKTVRSPMGPDKPDKVKVGDIVPTGSHFHPGSKEVKTPEEAKQANRDIKSRSGRSHLGALATSKDPGLKAGATLHAMVTKDKDKNIKPNLPKSEKMAKSNSDPDIYKIPDQFSEEEIYNAVRQDIMAEYDAINLYEAHKHASNNEKLTKILDHIIKEEKEHIQLLEDFLKENDQFEAKKDLNKSEHEKGVHESAAQYVPGKEMGRKQLTDKTYGHPGIPTHYDPKQGMGESTGRHDKKAHQEVLKELKDMPKPNLPKSEKIAKSDILDNPRVQGPLSRMPIYKERGDTKGHQIAAEGLKEGHKQKLQDIKDQSKPSLPKSESSAPKSARLTGVKITKKLPKPDDKPSVFFKEEKMEPEVGINKLMKFLENRKNKKK